MATYNPDQDVIVRELLTTQTSDGEEVRVRVRRYDGADGSPGKTAKLEVSRWRILVSGERKAKAGIRLTRVEAAAVLAALLDLDLWDVEVDDDWNVTIK